MTTAPAGPSGTSTGDPLVRRSRLPRLAGLLLAALAAMTVVLALAGGVPDYLPAGIPDPGAFTTWGLPVLGLASDFFALAVVGALLVPLLTMTTVGAELTGRTFRAVHAVRSLGLGWALVVLLEIWFTVSDQYAVPVWEVNLTIARSFVFDADQGQSSLAQLILVLMTAFGSRWVLTVRESTLVLGAGLLAVVPPVLTGHSASSGSHDAAIVSLLVHVVAVVLWVGGLAALWWHLGSNADLRSRAAARFSSLAIWCFAVTAVSGVLNATVRLGSLGAFFSSGYGRAALAKIVAMLIIGAIAYRVRRVARARMTADAPAWRGFALLTGIELLVMSVAVGLGVGLSRTPPPVGEPYQTLAESLLGGPLPEAPTVARFLFSFNVSGVGIAVVGLGAALYVAGVLALRRRGDSWPVGRTISWFVGLLVVGYATMGGLGVYSHVLFSAHMVSHMLLSMVAPIMLVLGSPITLALRALPGSDVPGGQGPRQLLIGALNSRYARFVTHPAVAAIVFIGSLYAIYFTDLFPWLMGNHLGHAIMEVHFLIAGFLYYEVLVGSAPLARRLPHLGRLAVLLVVTPFHAFFAIAVMSSQEVIGLDFYSLIDRPYARDLLADQYLAGSLTWALGEIPMVIVLIVLVFQWFRDDTRTARQRDRKADRDDDQELQAYNEKLARISRGEATRSEREGRTER